MFLHDTLSSAGTRQPQLTIHTVEVKFDFLELSSKLHLELSSAIERVDTILQIHMRGCSTRHSTVYETTFLRLWKQPGRNKDLESE